jgi:hypothetical protein
MGGAASAQENQTSPPAPLQFPFEAQANANAEFGLGILRSGMETSVDLILCEALMKHAGRPTPTPFRAEHCEPAFAQRVAADQGVLHWASGARPRRCGTSCFGHPMMTAQDQRNRPNLRRAMLYSHIVLTIDGPGADRNISIPVDAYFTCQTANGARDGDLTMRLVFGPPAIGEPGILESIGSFFTAGWLTSRIDSEIKKRLPNINPQQGVIGRCRSVGVARSDQPNFDAVKFDRPPTTRAPGVSAIAGTNALRDRVKIELLRVVRHPLPALVPQEHGRPGDPAAGQFTVFLNGVERFIPPQGLALPVTGGSAPINACMTVDVTGWNDLQVLFTNDLGGAAWSQFPRAGGFGQGTIRTLTTGRTVLVQNSSVDPTTGRPRPGSRPQSVPLREFELTYRLTFLSAPTVVAQPTQPSRPGRPGLAGTVLGTRPTAVLDSTSAPSEPCREI